VLPVRATIAMKLLWLKILLTPALVGALTLVARSWGVRMAGLLVALPLISGPVSVFLALEHGAAFSARAATGAVNGIVGVQAFSAAYALCARRASWPASVAVGVVACGCAITALQRVPIGLGAAVAVACATAVMLSRATRRLGAGPSPGAAAAPPATLPRWDLPLRMLVATALVVGLTAGATALGPAWSGGLSSMPVLTGVLAAFTHRRYGSDAVKAMLVATIGGTLGSVAFFGIVGALLAPGEALRTYVAATVAAAGLNAVLRRVAPGGCRPA
jgi:hypothetical protein